MQNTAIYFTTWNHFIYSMKYKEIKYTYNRNCLIGGYSTQFDVITRRLLSVQWVGDSIRWTTMSRYDTIYIVDSTGADKSYINFEPNNTIKLQYFELNWACLTSLTCYIRTSRLMGLSRHVASWGSVKLNPRLQEVMEYSIPSFLDTRQASDLCVDSRHGNIAPYPMLFA